MHPALLPLLTFLAVVMGVIGVVSLMSDMFKRDRARVQDRLDVEFRNKTRERAKRSLNFKDEILKAEGGQVLWLRWRDSLQALLDQSGLEMTLKQLLSYSGGWGAVVGLVAGLVRHSFLVALVGTALGSAIPVMYVKFKRNSRQEALRKQLSDAFDLMARILRAGQSMTQAMQGVASEFAKPIAEEFAYCSEQQNLGLSPEISMRDLARRTGLVEMNIFVVAVLVQRQVGGNLSEILEKLATVVRERYKIRGTIQTLTAEGRMQAGVLMALPPLLFMMMLLVNREYAQELLAHPALLWMIATGMLIGGLWIRKIVNFDF